MNEAAEVIRQTATDDTQIIFGATIDDRLTGQVWVTVIATGLGGTGRRAGPRTPSLVSALTAATTSSSRPPSCGTKTRRRHEDVPVPGTGTCR